MKFVIKNNTISLLNKKSNGGLEETKVFVDSMKNSISVIGYSSLSDEEILVGTNGRGCGYVMKAKKDPDGSYSTNMYKQAPAARVCDLMPIELDNQVSKTKGSQGVLITACSKSNNGVWLAGIEKPNWREVIGQIAIKEFTNDGKKVDLRIKIVETLEETAVKLVINYQSLRPSPTLSLETAISNNNLEKEAKTIEIDITSNLINLGFKLKETLTLNENYKKEYK